MFLCSYLMALRTEVGGKSSTYRHNQHLFNWDFQDSSEYDSSIALKCLAFSKNHKLAILTKFDNLRKLRMSITALLV